MKIILMIIMCFIVSCSGDNINKPNTIDFIDVTLAWDKNNIEEGIEGYKIYYSTESFLDRKYDDNSHNDFCKDVGNNITYCVKNLESHKTWYFVVTAYSDECESEYSNQAKK